jgi:hypothetical protein
MTHEDKTLENLLELNDVKFVIDETLGLWVKFQVQKIEKTPERPHGIRYSLTLHDRTNNRILGFDNSHAVEYSSKKKGLPRRIHDHWHRDKTDKGKPYVYQNAGKLLEDFWTEVDKTIKKLQEI